MRGGMLAEFSAISPELSLHKYGLRILTASIPENKLFPHFETRRAVWALNPRFISRGFAQRFSVVLALYQAHRIRTASSLFRCLPN